MAERWASLISGGGTTLLEMVKATRSGRVRDLELVLVIASSSNAGGLQKARDIGVPVSDIVVVDPNRFRGDDKKVDQYAFGQAVLTELNDHGATVVTQNGWLPFTPRIVIETYKNAIFNQHSATVPEFGGKGMFGKRPHAARLYFVRTTNRDYWTEAIAQRVDPANYDDGAIVKSEKVDILPDDTADKLAARVLPAEHRVQIALLQDVARGTLKEEPRRNLVRPGEEHILIEAKRLARLDYPHG